MIAEAHREKNQISEMEQTCYFPGFILYYPRLKKEQLLFIRLSISSPDGAVLSRRPVAERGRRDNTAPSGRTPESE